MNTHLSRNLVFGIGKKGIKSEHYIYLPHPWYILALFYVFFKPFQPFLPHENTPKPFVFMLLPQYPVCAYQKF
jgi:hypothetical protein